MIKSNKNMVLRVLDDVVSNQWNDTISLDRKSDMIRMIADCKHVE